MHHLSDQEIAALMDFKTAADLSNVFPSGWLLGYHYRLLHNHNSILSKRCQPLFLIFVDLASGMLYNMRGR